MSDMYKPYIDDPVNDMTDDEEGATRTTAPEPKTRIEKLLVKIAQSLGDGAEGIADVAQTLGIADKSEFTYPPVSITHALKELAVFCGAAESVDEIDANTVPEVLAFIAENGKPISGSSGPKQFNFIFNKNFDGTQITLETKSATVVEGFLRNSSTEIPDDFFNTANNIVVFTSVNNNNSTYKVISSNLSMSTFEMTTANIYNFGQTVTLPSVTIRGTAYYW